MVGIDTNILLYAHDRSSPLFEPARQFIADLCEDGIISLADLSLLEFYSVMTDGRKMPGPLPPFEVAEIIEDLLSADEFEICCLNHLIFKKSVSYARKYNITRYGINDIYIAQTLAYYGVDKIFTANIKDFKKFDFIKAVDPFAEIRNPQSKIRNRFIPYAHQSVDEKDVAAVCSALRSQWLTTGPNVEEFEQTIADYVGVTYAVAVSSGTAALHLACLASGIGSGDEGVTSPITFLASANTIAYCGATPRFADIDPRTYNMDAAALEKCITKRTRVVIPVHFAGQSCDMQEIQEIVSRKENLFGHKIFIIEDASHALGSRYLGHRVGCCEYADAAVFSFHPVKHITTGEGGTVVTNNQEMADRIRRLRSHGMNKDPKQFINKDLAFSSYPSPNPWYYEQIELGFNYRITDIQCALGSSQLKKLERFMARRRAIFEKYHIAFSELPYVIVPFEASQCTNNFHLYVLQINFDALGLTRAAVVEKLKMENILTQVHYIPVHIQPYYQKHYGTKLGDCLVAEQFYGRCLSLPFYPAMSDANVQKVTEQVCRLIEGEK